MNNNLINMLVEKASSSIYSTPGYDNSLSYEHLETIINLWLIYVDLL